MARFRRDDRHKPNAANVVPAPFEFFAPEGRRARVLADR